METDEKTQENAEKTCKCKEQEDKCACECNKQQDTVQQDYLNDLKRLQAEFDNYRKRIEKERQQFIQLGKEQILFQIADVYEALEKSQAESEANKIIFKQLNDIFAKESISEIQEKEFNPDFHEAVGSAEKFTIVQKGFKIKDKVLRHARVLVEEESKCQK